MSVAASTAPIEWGSKSIGTRIFENDFMTTSDLRSEGPRPPTRALATLALPISKQPAFQRPHSHGAGAPRSRRARVLSSASGGPLAESAPAVGDQTDGGL